MPDARTKHILVRVLAVALVVPWMVLALVLVENYARVPGFLLTSCLAGLIGVLVWMRVPGLELRRAWRACFRPRPLASSVCITVCLVVCLGLLPSILRGGLPAAEVHDEFSYLLGADTFLHGRLSNPTPAGWPHFESMHITVRPTYQSKYQPGMALVLALGKLLTGQAYAGTLFALAFATAAATWMFFLWLPPTWRLPMGCLTSLLLAQVWGDHYMVGGPLAFGAGALQLALLRRISGSLGLGSSTLYGVFWGLSLVLLGWTRPFEGCVYSIVVGSVLVWQHRRSLFKLAVRLMPGLALVLVPAGYFQVELNRAVTGSPWKLPYMEHEEQYAITPVYLFQALKSEPVYRDPTIHRFHQEVAGWYRRQHDLRDLSAVISFRFGQVWIYYGMVLWFIPLLVLPELWQRPATRGMLLLWCALLAVMQTVTWFMPHYVAPAAPAWLLVIAQGIRFLRVWRPGRRPIGRLVVVFLVITQVTYGFTERTAATLATASDWSVQRARLQQKLEALPDQYLILVRYAPAHNTGQEWVYNGADLPTQRVIWARAMSPREDRALAARYPEHRLFYLTVEDRQAVEFTDLTPLEGSH